MTKAIFFDLDDTLCDSRQAWSVAESQAIRYFLEQCPNLSESGIYDAWRSVQTQLMVKLREGRLTMAAVRDRRFKATLELLGVPDDGLAEQLSLVLGETYLANIAVFEDTGVLDELRPDFYVGIVTNGAADDSADSQHTKIQQLGLAGRVDGIWISDEVGFRKPDSRIFEAACEGASVSPVEAAFAGDSAENDIVGANRAGMTSILIDRMNHFRSNGDTEAHPAYRIEDLREIPSILKE